jgi:hypothetical protein
MAGKITPNGRSNFAGTINRTGIAKLSHFMLTFTAPSTAMGKRLNNNIGKAFQEDKKNRFVAWESEGITNLAFRCERVSLPGRIIVTSPYKEGNYGLVREYPTNAVYQPVDATFIMSEDYSEKIFFELWQDLIIGPHRARGDLSTEHGTKDLNYMDEFTCQMTIHCFSEVGGREGLKEVYNCSLQEAYPRTIQDLQLDWSSNDVVRLNVVFDYKYFQDQSFNEIESSAKPRLGGFFARTGLGAATASLGGEINRRKDFL